MCVASQMFRGREYLFALGNERYPMCRPRSQWRNHTQTQRPHLNCKNERFDSFEFRRRRIPTVGGLTLELIQGEDRPWKPLTPLPLMNSNDTLRTSSLDQSLSPSFFVGLSTYMSIFGYNVCIPNFESRSFIMRHLLGGYFFFGVFFLILNH